MAPSLTSHVPCGPELPEETVVDILYDEFYSWALLEDHPLRTPPTHCCPGLFGFIRGCCVTARKSWGERLFRVVCLLLMITIVVEFLSLLPLGLIHLLPHAELGGNGQVFGFSHNPAGCSAYHLQAGRDAINDFSAVGCIGVKVDIWMQNGSLWANDSMAAVNGPKKLSSAYFKSLLEKLDAMDSPLNSPVRSAEASPLGSFEEESVPSSILLLESGSPVQAVWPELISGLEMLREGRYLSYRNGTRLVLRSVTVVISSKDPSYLDRTNVTEPDFIFFDTSLDSLTRAHQQAQSTTEGDKEIDSDNLLSTAQAANHGTKGVPVEYSTTKTVMATADFEASVGLPRRGRFSKEQIELIRAQVRAAHQHGLLARYTGIQCHPRRSRKLILRVLAQEGVDLIENDKNDCERPWWNSPVLGRMVRIAEENLGF